MISDPPNSSVPTLFYLDPEHKPTSSSCFSGSHSDGADAFRLPTWEVTAGQLRSNQTCEQVPANEDSLSQFPHL